MTITLRQESATGTATKAASLTYAELDNNFIDLLNNKIQALDVNGDSGQSTVGLALANEKVVIAGGTGISTAVTTDSAGETVITITNTVADTDTDTTYTIAAQADGSNANLVLTGSDASTDAIQLTAGTGISLSVDSAGQVTITNTVADTDTDTTYTINAAADGTNVNFNLAGSDASTDTIQFVAGSGIQLTTDSAGAIEIINTVSGGIANVVEDTTPQLGGTLDGQGNEINNVVLEDYKETIYTGGTTTGTITPDVANGNVQSITLSGSITLNALGNPETGQSMTMLIKQPASGGPYTLTSTMLFAGGTKTLSTAANAVDIISIVYDGTTYFASLSTNFS